MNEITIHGNVTADPTVRYEGVPPGRLEALARFGLSSKAVMLRRLPEGRRTATLLATVGTLQVAAMDDALDLFAVLMATKLIAPAERAAVKDRLRLCRRCSRHR